MLIINEHFDIWTSPNSVIQYNIGQTYYIIGIFWLMVASYWENLLGKTSNKYDLF